MSANIQEETKSNEELYKEIFDATPRNINNKDEKLQVLLVDIKEKKDAAERNIKDSWKYSIKLFNTSADKHESAKALSIEEKIRALHMLLCFNSSSQKSDSSKHINIMRNMVLTSIVSKGHGDKSSKHALIMLAELSKMLEGKSSNFEKLVTESTEKYKDEIAPSTLIFTGVIYLGITTLISTLAIAASIVFLPAALPFIIGGIATSTALYGAFAASVLAFNRFAKSYLQDFCMSDFCEHAKVVADSHPNSSKNIKKNNQTHAHEFWKGLAANAVVLPASDDEKSTDINALYNKIFKAGISDLSANDPLLLRMQQIERYVDSQTNWENIIAHFNSLTSGFSKEQKINALHILLTYDSKTMQNRMQARFPRTQMQKNIENLDSTIGNIVNTARTRILTKNQGTFNKSHQDAIHMLAKISPVMDAFVDSNTKVDFTNGSSNNNNLPELSRFGRQVEEYYEDATPFRFLIALIATPYALSIAIPLASLVLFPPAFPALMVLGTLAIGFETLAVGVIMVGVPVELETGGKTTIPEVMTEAYKETFPGFGAFSFFRDASSIKSMTQKMAKQELELQRQEGANVLSSAAWL